MFEFLSFELIVHDSAGGVVFRVVTWIITVIIGLCPRCAKTPPKHRGTGQGTCTRHKLCHGSPRAPVPPRCVLRELQQKYGLNPTEMRAVFLQFLYRPNAAMRKTIAAFTDEMRLPPSYIAVHVRSGAHYLSAADLKRWKQQQLFVGLDVYAAAAAHVARRTGLRHVMFMADDFNFLPTFQRLMQPHNVTVHG